MPSSDEWDPDKSSSDNDDDYISEHAPSDIASDEWTADHESPKKNKIGKKRKRPRDKYRTVKEPKLDCPSRFVLTEKQFQKRKKEFELLIGDQSDIKEVSGLKLPKYLWNQLKKHQKSGIAWLWKRVSNNEGGILGDEMGLGKTLQVIALLAGLQHDQILRNVLIIVPATLQKQWLQEFDKWWPIIRIRVLTERTQIKPETVYICSYERQGSQEFWNPFTLSTDDLLDRNWNAVFCDEGHRLRNSKSLTTRTIKRINTQKRIILTGSPIMNSLMELWSLVDFVQPGLLGKLQIFNEELAIPISQGSQASSSPLQVATALRCAEEVRNIVRPILLRRLKSEVQLITTEKKEHVLFIKMTSEQEATYQKYLNSNYVQRIFVGGMGCFGALQKLRQIVSHPFFVGDKEGKISDSDIALAIKKVTLSGKMLALASLLGAWRRQNRKVLVFTQSLASLRMIVGMCERNNLPCSSISGKTAVGSRQHIVNVFNDSDEAFCLALTSRVGGVGLNIHGATRSVIFEPDWNPGQDEQAAARIHRPQQTDNVAVYRLITSESVEEWIYQRQVYKHSVAQFWDCHL